MAYSRRSFAHRSRAAHQESALAADWSLIMRHVLLLLLTSAATATSPGLSDHHTFQIIAKTGDVVPGQSALIGIGDSPSINTRGTVAFVGQFADGESIVTGDGVNPLNLFVRFSPGVVRSNIFSGWSVQKK
jgi:hypothetical protein